MVLIHRALLATLAAAAARVHQSPRAHIIKGADADADADTPRSPRVPVPPPTGGATPRVNNGHTLTSPRRATAGVRAPSFRATR